MQDKNPKTNETTSKSIPHFFSSKVPVTS